MIEGDIIHFVDIEAYARIAGVKIRTWEARLLRRMSKHYVDSSRKPEPPIQSVSDPASIKAMYRNLGGSKKRK